MASDFEVGFTVFDDETLLLQGIADLEYIDLDGVAYLAVASEADDAVTMFRLMDGAAPVMVTTISYTPVSGTLVASDISFIDGPNGPQLMTLGRYDDNFGLYDIDGTGALDLNVPLIDAGGTYNRGSVGIATTIGDRTIFYSASLEANTIRLFEVSAGQSPVHINHWEEISTGADDAGRRGVSAMAHFEMHGQAFLATSNLHDDRVVLWYTRWDGRLRFRDEVTNDDQLGISAVTALAGVQAEDRAFLLVANSMADSISVLRVSVNGTFNLVDTFYDTRDTRFGGITAMEVIEHDGRIFVFAGGADDGITLLELSHRGQLRLVAVIADDFPIALGNISSIEVRMEGDIAHVYVGSQNEHGFTELTIDLSRSGQDIRGGTGNDTLIGTSGDDVIWGMGHKDTLYGGNGDDRLIDGRGKDWLYGGDGADIFEFTEDGRSDFIMDFEIGIDRIDLSDFDHLYHISSLEIGTREGGAVIFVADDIIRITSVDGQPIDAALFTQDSFIFG